MNTALKTQTARYDQDARYRALVSKPFHRLGVREQFELRRLIRRGAGKSTLQLARPRG
jgi:hypothetical protein